MADATNKLGDYLILERIAQGGMAQVYKAKTVDPNGIERLVVIKRILPHISSNPEYVEMLIDEAKIAVHFTHGNIAQVYDLGRVGDDYFIVMEYVDGKTLGQIIRELKERGLPIPLDIIAFCIAEVCQGLDYIHRKKGNDGKPLGVVHRDISPQNIIVSYSGTVKLIDFGVAKAEDKMGQTESGVLKGKFAYMSPEQAGGEPVDRRSDIFSTGILLWELLTQERLFKRKTNMETIKAIRKARFDPPSKYRKEVSKDLEAIVNRALERKASRRYQFAVEMADDLMRFLMKHFPDFQPLHNAQFLYRYFGPEADEEGLQPELPELDIKKEEKLPPRAMPIVPIGEEKTEVDFMGRLRSRLQFLKLNEFVEHFRSGTRKKTVLVSTLLGLLLISGLGIYGFIRLTNKAILTVKVIPADAQLMLNDQPADPVENPYQFKLKSGEKVRLKVAREGYHPHVATLVLTRGEERNLVVVLRKTIPPFGSLLVTTFPSGATIYLDDLEWNQKTPAQLGRLKSDRKYRLGLYLAGHRFREEEIQVGKGETTRLHFNLTLDYASLEINSSPAGANVIIDDQIVGKTPYRNDRLPPGEVVNFVLELNGFTRIEESMALKGGEKKQLSFELKKNEN